VRRNFIERMRSLTGQYPYRCFDCQTRFFALREPHTNPQSGEPPEEIEQKIEKDSEEERD
jgi:hypothetical protein